MGVDALVPANVRFVRAGSAPGDPGITVFSSAAQDATAGYTIDLPAGVYDVFVEPRFVELREGEALPPLVLDGALTVALADPGDVQQFELAYSAPLRVTGFVVDRDAGAGIGDLFVRVVDAEGHPISTLGKTLTGTGAFSIGLAPQASEQPWSLEITTGAAEGARGETSARMVYRIARSALVTTAGLTGAQVRIAGLSRFGQTTEGACVGCVPIESSVERGDGSVVANAAVFMHSALEGLPPGHAAWFAVNTTTNSAGTFTASILPGNYQAIITPSDDGDSAITPVSFSIATMLRGRTFRLNPRALVQGVVRTEVPRATGMAGVTVRAVPLRDAVPQGASGPTIAARASEVDTARDGTFTLKLDPGRYLLLAQPDASSGFATTMDPVVVDVREGHEATLRTIVMGAPIALRGHVRDPFGQPVEDARVTAFARVAYALSTGATATVDVELSRAQSAMDGSFESLLPPGLLAR
jgi:hypothetical protein